MVFRRSSIGLEYSVVQSAILGASFLLLALPSFAFASSLVWGDQSGGTPAQIEISDGGTYEVPLNTEAPGYINVSPTYSGPFFGSLYRIDDSSGTAIREFITTVNPQDPGYDIVFGWPQAGQYELEIHAIAVVSFNDHVKNFFAYLLFADVASAQSFGDPLETIHFTIHEAQSGCTLNCNSNVLFLPGLEASRLYRPARPDEAPDTVHRLWEPDNDLDAQGLLLNADGTSARNDIFTNGVLDEAFVPLAGPNIYKSFIAQMNTLESSGKIADWLAAPYDWRLSLDQLLSSGTKTGDSISYLTATDTPFIEQELHRLAASSRTGAVTIIAHSNGGLVAKALMQKLGSVATAQLIDKVIFVAVP